MDRVDVQSRLLVLTVAAAAFLTYLLSLRFQFVYDDLGQIVNNERIRSWTYLPAYFTQHVWAHMPDIAAQFYRPLFLVWLRINYALFGTQPAGWHVTSIAAHVLATVLLYTVASRTTKNNQIAAIAALIFAVYPVHVESVAWVSGSADVLLAIATFAAMLAFTRDDRRSTASGVMAFTVALLLKETAIVLLPVIFLQIYLQQQPPDRARKAAARVVPLFAVFIVYAGLRFAALSGFGATTSNVPLTVTLAAAPRLLWWYLRKLCWPADLSAFHDFELGHTTFASVALPLLGVIAFTVALWALTRYVARSAAEKSAAMIASTLIILPIIPVLKISSLDPANLVHERYLYLPSAGFCILLGICLNRIFETALPHPEAGLLITAIVAALLATVTINDSRFWKDELSLYTRGLQTAPRSVAVKNNLAVALIENGNCADAMPLLQEATQFDDKNWLAYANMGQCAVEVQDWINAEKYYSRAVELNPLPVLVEQLGSIRRKLKR